ncbi:MAG: hypothetical protein A3J28_05670 [Acidobacteria bacterium RIFCSPLOWO2_12_FULL_60_22]|nr:MAG: hypothetical protein A3J28_05670 [Acidobacteria bacterium RIFCSPLOWO2_12_FULL_60_22]
MKANQSRRKSCSDEDTMRPEYDFRKGVRGKHAARYAAGTNVVVLEPDVAAEFRNAEEVNETLRAVAGILRRRQKRANRKTA